MVLGPSAVILGSPCGSAEDDGVGLSGGFETPHLAGIEKSHRIDLAP